MVQLSKGQLVWVRLAGSADDWCRATVKLVSPNRRAVGLELDGSVHAAGRAVITGALPLVMSEESTTSVFGDEYELEPVHA